MQLPKNRAKHGFIPGLMECDQRIIHDGAHPREAVKNRRIKWSRLVRIAAGCPLSMSVFEVRADKLRLFEPESANSSLCLRRSMLAVSPWPIASRMPLVGSFQPGSAVSQNCETLSHEQMPSAVCSG